MIDMRKAGLWTIVVVTMIIAIACGKQNQSGDGDELMERAYKSRDYSGLVRQADSLESIGQLSPAKAYYWRGYACDRQKKLRMAEFYWKTSLRAAADTKDYDTYAKTASRLANLLVVRGDYEGALKMAVPVAEKLEAIQCRDDASYKDAIAGLINMSVACNTTKHYQEALKWTGHFGELLSEYEQRPEAGKDYLDKQLARFHIYQAQAYEGLEKPEDANKAYEAFLTRLMRLSLPRSSARLLRGVFWLMTIWWLPSDGMRPPTTIGVSMPILEISKAEVILSTISRTWCYRNTRPISWQAAEILRWLSAVSSATRCR